MLLLALALSPVVSGPPADASCPRPGLVAPSYPVNKLRSGTPGKAIVLARIDECGRVVEARIETGSGHSDLDAAALDAAKASVLSPEQRAKVPTGWVKLPFSFVRPGNDPVKAMAPDWPASHKRPVYLPDDQPIGFDTIEALRDAKLMRDVWLKSPYGSVQGGQGTWVTTGFEQEQANPQHFWLSYNIQTGVAGASGARRYETSTVAMARYRLVQEDGRPVVRLGLLCEASAEECDQLSNFLLKGLPIAKPPRR